MCGYVDMEVDVDDGEHKYHVRNIFIVLYLQLQNALQLSPFI